MGDRSRWIVVALVAAVGCGGGQGARPDAAAGHGGGPGAGGSDADGTGGATATGGGGAGGTTAGGSGGPTGGATQLCSFEMEGAPSPAIQTVSCFQIWSYTPTNDLGTSILGDVQRLPNGNTLITYSQACEAPAALIAPSEP